MYERKVQKLKLNMAWAPTNSLLQKIFDVIRHAIQLKSADGTFWFGPRLWGDSPGQVSDKISRAMDELLDYNEMFIPEGSYVSSHSWRKTGMMSPKMTSWT